MRYGGVLTWIGLIAALALLLVACDVLPDAGVTVAAPTVTATAAVVEPTDAPPTEVVATPTVTPTPPPTATPGPSPTPEPAALLTSSVAPVLLAILPSPDESLRAEVVSFPCTAVGDDPNPIALEVLRVVDPAAGVEYQIDSQLLACGGLGAFGLEPLAWSADNRFLWYTDAREGGPDGACRPWARPVTLLDVANWSALTLESAAFGPFGQRVAGWLNGELLIFALDGSELGRLVPAALPPLVGPPVWSPDGTALAYLQYTTFCGETTGESAVVLVDPNTFEQRVLATESLPELESIGWVDAGHLSLAGMRGAGQWVYDLATDAIRSE